MLVLCTNCVPCHRSYSMRFKRCSAARVARLIGISQLHPFPPNWESVLSVLCSHWANSAQSSIEVRLTPEPFTGYQPYPLLGSAASICGCNGVEHQLRGIPFGVCAEPEFAGNGGFGFWWVSRLGYAARTSAGLFKCLVNGDSKRHSIIFFFVVAPPSENTSSSGQSDHSSWDERLWRAKRTHIGFNGTITQPTRA